MPEALHSEQLDGACASILDETGLTEEKKQLEREDEVFLLGGTPACDNFVREVLGLSFKAVKGDQGNKMSVTMPLTPRKISKIPRTKENIR